MKEGREGGGGGLKNKHKRFDFITGVDDKVDWPL